MSCGYRYPCYSLCYSQTSRCCSPCDYQGLCNYLRRYDCNDCCSYRTTCTTQCYYPSCCNYRYDCCYPRC